MKPCRFVVRHARATIAVSVLLVLTPTRELALQVAEACQRYAHHMPDFHVLPIYGGQDYTSQLRQLNRGAHVVFGLRRVHDFAFADAARARLTQADWRVVVATNQSGIGRGLFDMSALSAMHLKMHQLLAVHGGRIDAAFVIAAEHAPVVQVLLRSPGVKLMSFEQSGAYQRRFL